MLKSYRCWQRSLLLTLSLVLSACGDPVENPTESLVADVDVGIDADFEVGTELDGTLDTTETDAAVDTGSQDAAQVTPNLCGGVRELVYRGLPAEPSAECGPCDDGVLVCDGPNAVRCWGASQLNGCGTCAVLAAEPGEACGICLDSEYACEMDGSVACSGAGELNACGGCGKLEGDPGFICESEGGDGITLCRSETEVTCVGANGNACGGMGALDPLPTQPCGECSGGVTSCDGAEATSCTRADRWLNSCGGCAPLAAEPDEACGLCNGNTICHPDDPNRAICDDPNRNACGGCEPLDGVAGEVCGDGEAWHCDGVDAVRCGDESLNDCGGEGTLDTSPGVACGPCGDGVQICASPEVIVCVDALQRNVCGGCSLLPGVPGAPCGAAYTWQCAGGDLGCLPDDGTSVARIGDSCTELLECESGLCLIVNSEAELGICSILCIEDLDCPEGFECEVLSVDTEDAVNVCFLRTLCVDPDTDGYGVGPACLGVDCDETETAINQDAVDVCDGTDNNCNGSIDENNGDCGDPVWIQCTGDGRRASCQEVDACAVDAEGINYCGVAHHWRCTEQSDAPPLCEDIAECLDVETWLPDCDLDWYECVEQEGAPPTCEDTDECAVDNGGCNAPYFTCRDVEGGPRECLDVDECQADAFGMNGCGDASQYDCSNQIGTDPICADHDGCEAVGGYNDCGFAEFWDCVDREGAPPLCSDRNECLENNGGCDLVYDDCFNRTALPPVCQDRNECLVDNGGCENPRIFECVDNVGASPTCRDLDDCQVAFDGTNACGVAEHWECTNNDEALATCVDRDECEAVLGGNVCGDIARDWLCEDNVGAAPTCTGCMGVAVNLDSDGDNGCEYLCTSTGLDVCNHSDDDCDGHFDETTDFASDPGNCGDCGVVCAVPVDLGVASVTCVEGTCLIHECELGFFDRDLDPNNGCEVELTGAIIWVDASTGTAGGPGTAEAPFATIQQGVGAASAGDLVRVLPGSYTGPIIVNTQGVTVEGEDRDTVIVSTARASIDIGFDVQAGGVTIAHMTLSGGRTGVHFRGQMAARIADVGAHDLAISQVLSGGQGGVQANGVSAADTTRLSLSLLEITSVVAADGGGTGSSQGGRAAGLLIERSDACRFAGNRIADVRAGRGVDTLFTGWGGSAYGGILVDVVGCTIAANQLVGVTSGDGAGNDGEGRTAAGGGTAMGFALIDSQNITFMDNTMSAIFGGDGGPGTGGAIVGGGGRPTGISVTGSVNVVIDGLQISDLVGGDRGSGTPDGSWDGNSTGLAIADSTTVDVSHLAISNINPGTSALARCVDIARVTGLTLDNLSCAEIGRQAGWGIGVNVQSGQNSTVWLTNSIIAGTTLRCLHNASTSPTALSVAYSILWDCGATLEVNTSLGDGVRNIDPLFVNTAVPDLVLWPTSPAIDAGQADTDYDLEPSPNGCRPNLGAHGGTSWAVPAPGADDCPPGG